MHYPVTGHKEGEAGNWKDQKKKKKSQHFPQKGSKCIDLSHVVINQDSRRKNGSQVKLNFETKVEM